jgi:glucuronate isomerase
MCSKILKANGNTRHTATFVALTDDDMQDTEVQKMQEVFNRTLCKALGPGIEKGDYPEDETPEYEPYQDNQEVENEGLSRHVSDRVLEQTSFVGYSQVCCQILG